MPFAVCFGAPNERSHRAPERRETDPNTVDASDRRETNPSGPSAGAARDKTNPNLGH